MHKQHTPYATLFHPPNAAFFLDECQVCSSQRDVEVAEISKLLAVACVVNEER